MSTLGSRFIIIRPGFLYDAVGGDSGGVLGLRLIDGQILLGPALTALILAPEYFLPVREVGNDYHATLNGQEAGKPFKRFWRSPVLKKKSRSNLIRGLTGMNYSLRVCPSENRCLNFICPLKGRKSGLSGKAVRENRHSLMCWEAFRACVR